MPRLISARPGGREAELDAGEEKLAPLREPVLLGHPPVGLLLGDPVAAGHVPPDQREDGRAVGVGGELGGGEGVALGAARGQGQGLGAGVDADLLQQLGDVEAGSTADVQDPVAGCGAQRGPDQPPPARWSARAGWTLAIRAML
jgi:hypothetical protein